MNADQAVPEEGSFIKILFVMKKFPASLVTKMAQDGFLLASQAECTLRHFLSNEYGIANDYLETRISTVFLDGCPVDDMDSALIRSGSVIALSAAMPGVVGAAMRRDGAYAALRSSITYKEVGVCNHAGMVMVRLKLFNLVMQELGRSFLERGVYLQCDALAQYLAGQVDDFWNSCGDIVINGKNTSYSDLQKALYQGNFDIAHLTIQIRNVP